MDRWDEDELQETNASTRTFSCPYCWERVEPPIEQDLEGDLVWDCEVCCRPWLIHVAVDYEGNQVISVERAQN